MANLTDRANDMIDGCGYDPFAVLEHAEIYAQEDNDPLAAVMLFWVQGYAKGLFDGGTIKFDGMVDLTGRVGILLDKLMEKAE